MSQVAGSKKIVVTDDDVVMADLLGFLLRERGHSVFVAKDADEALRLVLAEKPDLLVLDLHLPPKDGFVVMEEMRRSSGMNGTRILILSASEGRQDRRRAEELGARAFVVKPFDCEELVRRVDGLLAEGEGG